MIIVSYESPWPKPQHVDSSRLQPLVLNIVDVPFEVPFVIQTNTTPKLPTLIRKNKKYKISTRGLPRCN
jgi:hypothetical protein